MYTPRRPRRPFTLGINMRPITKASRRKVRVIIILLVVLAIMIPASLQLRSISAVAARMQASDMITYAINDTVLKMMSQGGYNFDDFVVFEKDTDGKITAFSTNTTLINSLSSELIKNVIEDASSGALNVKIPLGNLIGTNLSQGKGPQIPLDIIMLSSSHADYINDFASSGINQTQHKISLNVSVDVIIIVPWTKIETTVTTEVLLVETVIVGQVPQTYITME